MKPSEARVLICEDDVWKLKGLEAMVQEGGGRVVGTAKTMPESLDAVRTIAELGVNVALLDGNISEFGRFGQEGSQLFQSGYRDGLLHRVDTSEGVGAVAIGCSDDATSDVATSVGGNITIENGDLTTQWSRLLLAHPAEPFMPVRGTVDRLIFDDFLLDEIIDFIADTVSVDTTILLQHVEAVHTRYNAATDSIEFLDEMRRDGVLTTMKDVLRWVRKWQAIPPVTRAQPEARTFSMSFVHNALLHVVSHNVIVAGDVHWGENRGLVDRIATNVVADLPENYVRKLGLPTLDIDKILRTPHYQQESLQL